MQRNTNKPLWKRAQLFSVLLVSGDYSPLSTPLPPESTTVTSNLSHLHQYFSCPKYLVVTYINTRNGYEKWNCRVLCLLEELNINQDFSQDIKTINRQDVQIISSYIAQGKKNMVELTEVYDFRFNRICFDF